jgi:hypothetical protein
MSPDRSSRVIVQRITTAWTKRSRGAAGRELRARLPAAYPLPDGAIVSRSHCVLHEIARSEASAYGERFGVAFDEQPKSRIRGPSAVQLTYKEAGLEIALQAADKDTGRPTRARMPPKLVRSGEFATVRFNGRFAGYDFNWYEDKIIHIAFEMTPCRGLFLEASAAFVMDARLDLW